MSIHSCRMETEFPRQSPAPRIYRSAKNNRDGETLENGYGRPTRIKLCVRRHICLLSRGDKMAGVAGLLTSRSWPFATINDRSIRIEDSFYNWSRITITWEEIIQRLSEIPFCSRIVDLAFFCCCFFFFRVETFSRI